MSRLASELQRPPAGCGVQGCLLFAVVMFVLLLIGMLIVGVFRFSEPPAGPPAPLSAADRAAVEHLHLAGGGGANA